LSDFGDYQYFTTSARFIDPETGALLDLTLRKLYLSVMNKAEFLQQDVPHLLRQIPADTPASWGKMNVQQMIEHMSDSVRIANGRDLRDCITPEEHLDRMQAFLKSDKPFKENTVNSLMGEVPEPCRFERIEDSLGDLEEELKEFQNIFEQDKSKQITNPFFGDLNYEEWVQLLYKHFLHHLRQFGVVPDTAAVVS
jgi:hypothetical protein